MTEPEVDSRSTEEPENIPLEIIDKTKRTPEYNLSEPVEDINYMNLDEELTEENNA